MELRPRPLGGVALPSRAGGRSSEEWPSAARIQIPRERTLCT